MMEAQALQLCNSTCSAEVFSPARKHFDRLIGRLQGPEKSSEALSDIEVFIDEEGREVLRQLLQGYLELRQLREVTHEEVVGDDDLARRQRRYGQKRVIESLFGGVGVQRTRYETPGARSLAPLDGDLNLPKEKYSHSVGKRLSQEVTRGSFDAALSAMSRNTGAHVPKRQAEQLTQRSAQDFDVFYETQQEALTDRQVSMGELTGLAGDSKGVLVHHQDLREQTRKAANRKAAARGDAVDDDEHTYQKRMATAGAVYNTERYFRTPEQVVERMRLPRSARPKTAKAPKPRRKRVWASIDKDSTVIVEETVQEAVRRDPFQWSQWFATVDGDYTLLKTYERMRQKYGLFNLVIICDIIHVLGYLCKAAKVFRPRSRSKAERWTYDQLLEILRGRCSVVAAAMRRSATRRKFSEKKRKPVDACARYLLNHKAYLRYDEYMAAGLPISSGVIEGTVRHLINDRMAITGARWRLRTAEAVLRIRALCASGDFEAYWAFHERQELRRNHQSKYKDDQIPKTTTSGMDRTDGPHLQIVR